MKGNNQDDYVKQLQDRTTSIRFEEIPQTYLSDREIQKALLGRNGQWFKNLIEVDPSIADDADLVGSAVKQDGRALQFASERLRSDKKIVLAAVQVDSRSLEYASFELRSNKEVVLVASQQNGVGLQRARPNKKFGVSLEVKGMALEWASPKLLADKSFMIEAVTCNGWALAYASPELQRDKDVVLPAVKQEWQAIQYASSELVEVDKDIMFAMLEHSFYFLKYASEKLQNDLEFVKTALEQKGDVWTYHSYVSKELKHPRYGLEDFVKQTKGDRRFKSLFWDTEKNKDRQAPRVPSDMGFKFKENRRSEKAGR